VKAGSWAFLLSPAAPRPIKRALQPSTGKVGGNARFPFPVGVAPPPPSRDWAEENQTGGVQNG